uniref:Uncharacterized protein n=1 Tax=Schizaphis graminum TaxID=13262 RepID=A0A2S2PHC9_SCHGA
MYIISIYTALDRDNGLQSAQSYVIHYTNANYIHVYIQRSPNNELRTYTWTAKPIIHLMIYFVLADYNNNSTDKTEQHTMTTHTRCVYIVGGSEVIFLGIFYPRYNIPRLSLLPVKVS